MTAEQWQQVRRKGNKIERNRAWEDQEEEELWAWKVEGCLMLWWMADATPGPIRRGRWAGLGMEQGEQPGPSEDEHVF